MMNRILRFTIVALAIAALAGCSPAPIEFVATPDEGAGPAGFWLGLWHGFTLLFTFIVSLFSDSVGVYEANNNGGWYNLGFVLGAMAFFGGSGGGASKRKRCC